MTIELIKQGVLNGRPFTIEKDSSYSHITYAITVDDEGRGYLNNGYVCTNEDPDFKDRWMSLGYHATIDKITETAITFSAIVVNKLVSARVAFKDIKLVGVVKWEPVTNEITKF